MKNVKENIINKCCDCPFLDKAVRGDLCDYCDISGGEVDWNKQYISMPLWCPLRKNTYIIKTKKR